MLSNRVTICVISYNSQGTILETLNSILTQTYKLKNIEVVISDDGSSDNTKAIVDKWVEENYNLFYDVITIFPGLNKGVSANCNQGWRMATSSWIKTIAADDLLLSNCIYDNISFCNENKGVACLFSYMDAFIVGECGHESLYKLPAEHEICFFSADAPEQYQALLNDSVNFAPSSFISKKLLDNINYCDEKYKLIEDLPLWLKITKNDYKLHFMSKVTVKYRISNSLSNSTNRLVNLDFIEQLETMHKDLIWPNLHGLAKWRVFDKVVDLYSWKLTAKIFNNKKSKYSVAFRTAILFFRPSTYTKFCKRMRLGRERK